jgi:hypothetical protein
MERGIEEFHKDAFFRWIIQSEIMDYGYGATKVFGN